MTTGWPPSSPTSPTARSGCTPARRKTRSSSRSHSRRLVQLAPSAARVRQIAAGLGQAAVIPPEGRPTRRTAHRHLRRGPGPRRRRFFEAGEPRSWRRGSGLYVATPALLRHLGIDPATVDRSADFLADPTVPIDEFVILDIEARRQLPLMNVQRIDSLEVLGAGETAPRAVLVRHPRRSAPPWLEAGPERLAHRVEQPSDGEQIAAARELAADAGLEIETQRERTSLAAPIAIATAAGALLALAILAMTVGLIRSEAAGDLRTLTATGATGRIRRTLTAATAGALALLGALLGVAGAYLALAATYHDDLGYLSRVPVLPLVLIVVGVPLAAVGAGWPSPAASHPPSPEPRSSDRPSALDASEVHQGSTRDDYTRARGAAPPPWQQRR